MAKLAQFTGKRWPVVGRRLVDEFPYLEAEVKYAVKEYACTAVDVLARRTRLAFLHVHAADEAIPKIIDIMGKELGWSKARMKVNNIITSSYIAGVPDVLGWGGGGPSFLGCPPPPPPNPMLRFLQ